MKGDKKRARELQVKKQYLPMYQRELFLDIVYIINSSHLVESQQKKVENIVGNINDPVIMLFALGTFGCITRRNSGNNDGQSRRLWSHTSRAFWWRRSSQERRHCCPGSGRARGSRLGLFILKFGRLSVEHIDQIWFMIFMYEQFSTNQNS